MTDAVIDTEFDLTTLQGIFDHVAARTAEQGQGAYDHINEKCRYRSTSDGGVVCKCAAGHLMPDNDDLFTLLGTANSGRVQSYLDPRIAVQHTNTVKLIRQMQVAHDTIAWMPGAAFMTAWRQRMVDIAHTYALDDRLVA